MELLSDNSLVPEQPLALMLSSRDSVQLAGWGSHENSGAPEDLQTCLPSRAPSDSPGTAHGTSGSSSSSSTGSSPPAGHKAMHDLACLTVAAASGSDQAFVHPRVQVGGHRSLPGVADFHPQEVVVKVQVQQRSKVDSFSKQNQGLQQGSAHARAQQFQQQHNYVTASEAVQQQEQPQEQQQEQEHQQVQQEQEQQHDGQGEQQQDQQEHQKQQEEQQPAVLGICSTRLKSHYSQDVVQEQQQAAAPHLSLSHSRTSSSSCMDGHPVQAVHRRLVPTLDLSRAQLGKTAAAAARALTEQQALTRSQVDRDAELCLEHSSRRSIQLHPNAPMQDNRCYHYRAMAAKDVAAVRELLSRLQEDDAAQVQDIWDALLMARRDCEAMAARGVRVSRDISRDWQETVSDLIDRVVAQDTELGQLRQQIKAAQASPAATSSTSSALTAGLASGTNSSANSSSVEDLHGQVVRLKRHRDRLLRDQQELSRDLAETRLELQVAQHKAAEAQEQLAFLHQQAQELRDQHVSLLQQHIELAAYAEGLEAAAAAAACMQQQPQHPMPQPQPLQHHLLQQQQPLPAYVLSPCPQPLPAAAPGLAAAQGMGWVLGSIGQELCPGALEVPSGSGSLPVVWAPYKQQLPQQQHQAAWGYKPGRLQAPQLVLGVQLVQQGAEGAPGAAMPAQYPAAAAAGPGVGSAAGGSVKGSSSRWLQSGLSSLANIGRHHKHSNSTVSQHGAAAAVVDGSQTPVTITATAAPTAEVSASAASGIASSSASFIASDCRQQLQLQQVAPLQQPEHSVPVMQQRPGSSIARCTTSTLEQAAAAVAGLPSAHVGLEAAGTAAGKASRRFAGSCPGKVAVPCRLPAASFTVGGSSHTGAAGMASAVSNDIPQNHWSDHTPRGLGSRAHASKAAVFTAISSGTATNSMCSPHMATGDASPRAGLEFVAPTTSHHFDQAEAAGC